MRNIKMVINIIRKRLIPNLKGIEYESRLGEFDEM